MPPRSKREESRPLKNLIPDSDEGKKLAGLLTEYGAKNWRELALALATEYHPAFSKVREEGHPEKWRVIQRAVLLCEVAFVMSRDSCNRKDACRTLAESDHWKQFLARQNRPGEKRRAKGKTKGAEALYKQLQRRDSERQVFDLSESGLTKMIDAGYTEEWQWFVHVVLHGHDGNN